MRRVKIDIAGTTDANGNFSQVIQLDKTGEWRNVKVAIGTSGPAEWALTSGGTPLTYGRGRRVTLGPELLDPFDTLTVSCTGGPVSAAVQGSCTGQAGAEQEIVTAYVPAPNTIALDTATPRVALRPKTVTTTPASPSFSVASGGLSGAQIFTISPGCIALRIIATAGGLLFTYSLLVLGRQSNAQYFGSVLAPGSSTVVPTPTLPITIPVEQDWDSQVEIHVEHPTQNVNIFVSELFDVEAPGQAGASQSVISPLPGPWQAPTNMLEIHSSPPLTTAWASIIAAAPSGTSVWLHYWQLGAEGTPGSVFLSTSNVSGGFGTNPGIFGEIRLSAVGVPANAFTNHGAHDFRGFNAGAGPIYWAADSSVFVGGALGYSYG